MKLYKEILRQEGLVHLKTDSEFLHCYTLGVLESFNIKPIFSNHNIYKNNNAPFDVINIKTHYEKMFLESNKNISYLCFNFFNE